MSTLYLVWKNIIQQIGSTILSIMLTAFGVAILCVILISGRTLEKQLDNNTQNIDLVVGAKGSPMQLILSSLYHIDNPTGNIRLSEAKSIADNPYIKLAVPLSLGDNYKGHRIIGTDSTFLDLYQLELDEGSLFHSNYEIIIGSEVALKHQLQIGDSIYGSHGLHSEGHTHDDHPFIVKGILKKRGNIVDNLLLCNLQSVWDIHGIHDSHANTSHNHLHSETSYEHASEGESLEDEVYVKNIGADMWNDQELEITALLIQYSSPAAIASIPRLVNQSTQLQSASPAIESARLFSLLGIGFDSLALLAYVIIIIAGLSVFISLYNALKDRKFDLAIMRTMGASKIKLFSLLIVEGIIITGIGSIIGLILGHGLLFYVSKQTSESADFIQVYVIYKHELTIVLCTVLIGILAAIIPALKAYNTTIASTLSE